MEGSPKRLGVAYKSLSPVFAWQHLNAHLEIENSVLCVDETGDISVLVDFT